MLVGAERHAGDGGGRAFEGGGILVSGANGGVRADKDALVALDTEGGVPLRNLEGDGAFFELGGGGRPAAVGRDGADREQIALAGEQAGGDIAEDALGEGGVTVGRGLAGGSGGERGGHRNLDQGGEGGVHGGVVHLDDVVALAGVGFGDGLLDVGDGLVLREHAGEGEETGLENGVGAAAHAGGVGDAVGINDEEADFFGDEGLLPRSGKF